MYKKRIITSDDGSHTIELIGQNEQYHSTHGAIQESNHVYIKHGLEIIAQNESEINILEIGMGTGLNVLLTWLFALEHGLKIKYLAIEAYPIEEHLWGKLNYPFFIKNDKATDTFNKIHSSKWGIEEKLDKNFYFMKREELIQDSFLPKNVFNVVYYDAFNPDLEPDLWTKKVFEKVFLSMKNQSVLSTYSTKGVIKRALKSCGFKIEKKPGPPGKREILNAFKATENL